MKHLLSRSRCLIALVVTLSISMGAQGVKDTGEDLLKRCSADLGDPHHLQCIAFFDGFSSALDTLVALAMLSQEDYCAPSALPPRQMIRVVADYLEEHPEKLHYHRNYVIILALAKAFPCEHDK